MAELFANTGDPDQMPHFAASDLGLHCLPITHLRVSRLQWVNSYRFVYTLSDGWQTVQILSDAAESNLGLLCIPSQNFHVKIIIFLFHMDDLHKTVQENKLKTEEL